MTDDRLSPFLTCFEGLILAKLIQKRERGIVAKFRKTIVVNTTLVAVMLVLAVGHGKSPDRLMTKIRHMETQASQITKANPANVVSSCSALVAVFFAWRSFTGYRRRCDG